ncbi:MAG: cysteine desulfurase [Actinobacteria bacterium]|nr:cysteine desulfurase [Actinomycetota bacterium]
MSIYLDHAATTPMVDAAIEAMTAQMKKLGNPSSLHTHGRAIRKEVEGAREIIAAAVGCLPSEVIFTGSGTEADNIALKGLFWAGQALGRNLVVISAIEHHAILDTGYWLAAHEGAELVLIGVDSHGLLNLGELTDLISRRGDEIAVISVMASNNETGVIQPIAEVVELARINSIPVHCDAVQSFGKVPLSFSELGVTALTLSAHKIGGPLGIGVLVLRRALEIPALLHGGGQEREIRSGTLNAPSILAFAAAAKESVERFGLRNFRMEEIRDDFAKRVVDVIPDAYINGIDAPRLPGIINVTFPGTESETLLLLLDAEGISCSTGSACSAGVQRPSHVLLAMGHDDRSARSTLRFSLGASSTLEEIDETLDLLPSVIERGRMANLR